MCMCVFVRVRACACVRACVRVCVRACVRKCVGISVSDNIAAVDRAIITHLSGISTACLGRRYIIYMCANDMPQLVRVTHVLLVYVRAECVRATSPTHTLLL